MHGTRLVVPCYNEERRLDPDAFERFQAAHPRVRYVFVDDGSLDATAERLAALCERLEGARLVRLDRNRGKAEAVRRGMLAAFERDGAEGGFAGWWDGDLSTPLEELPRLEAALDESPERLMAMGARVKLLGLDVDRSLLRHYPGRIFATFASLALGVPVYDTQCGAKLVRDVPSVRAVFAEPFIAGWSFDVEVLARLLAAERSGAQRPAARLIQEVPLHVWHERPGSKVRALDFVAALRDLARIRRRYGRAAG